MANLFVGVTIMGLYFGQPVLGGAVSDRRMLPNGELRAQFVLPPLPCDSPTCKQTLFEMKLEPAACSGYLDPQIENIDFASILMRATRNAEFLRIESIGDASGRKFEFRAMISELCTPAS